MRLSLLLLAACLATAATAQNTASVVAGGNDNDATVDQSGEALNDALVLQGGDTNSATVRHLR